jgi:hypothetical protein
MPQHTTSSPFADAGQNLGTALNLINIADSAAETFGADPQARQELKKGLVIGACALVAIILLAKLTD